MQPRSTILNDPKPLKFRQTLLSNCSSVMSLKRDRWVRPNSHTLRRIVQRETGNIRKMTSQLKPRKRSSKYGELRLRLHGRSFQSKRFHDLETASKTTRFRRIYTEPIPTVKSNRLYARSTIFTSRASQFRARPFLNRCSFAVYTTKETVSF